MQRGLAPEPAVCFTSLSRELSGTRRLLGCERYRSGRLTWCRHQRKRAYISVNDLVELDELGPAGRCDLGVPGLEETVPIGPCRSGPYASEHPGLGHGV